MLTIEITEDNLSGRVISITIQYEDILHADCFNGNKEDAYSKTQALNNSLTNQIDRLNEKIRSKDKEIATIQNLLDKANVEIDSLNGKLKKKSNQYLTIQKKITAFMEAYEDVLRLKDKFPASLAESLEEETQGEKIGNLEFLTLEE